MGEVRNRGAEQDELDREQSGIDQGGDDGKREQHHLDYQQADIDADRARMEREERGAEGAYEEEFDRERSAHGLRQLTHDSQQRDRDQVQAVADAHQREHDERQREHDARGTDDEREDEKTVRLQRQIASEGREEALNLRDEQRAGRSEGQQLRGEPA